MRSIRLENSLYQISLRPLLVAALTRNTSVLAATSLTVSLQASPPNVQPISLFSQTRQLLL